MALDDELGLSPMARERRKWELTQRDGGMRPNGHEEYPKMLYRAMDVQGRIEVDDQQHCRLIVMSREHEDRAKRDGWCHSVSEARDAMDRQQSAVAEEAAQRAMADRKLSEPARREADAYDQSQSGHVAEIPVRKKRGRPSKAELAARQA